MKKRSFRRMLIYALIMLVILLAGSGTFYSYWNNTTPENTCASCHEIEHSVATFTRSVHLELKCSECHGTALSNGFHSIAEKGLMVVNHIRKSSFEDIRLTEEQVLEVMENCIRCHAAENAKWLSGGHSATYVDILLNEKHNKTEQLNSDCLRCHGMFADGSVSDLVEPLNITGPWKLKNPALANHPVIPCLACHQVHAKGSRQTRPDYANPRKAFYQRIPVVSKNALYYRPDRLHISAENLPQLKLWEGERQVIVSDDLRMRTCIQCHAPDARHQAGTSDDRTPRGVHEGLSCLACHDPHSNDARSSCLKCHPSISNCNLDVTLMNTSYHDHESANNIHWVDCSDCHKSRDFRRN